MKIIHFASLIEGYLDELLVKEILKGIAGGLDQGFTFNRHSKFAPFKGGSKNKSKVVVGVKNLSFSIALEIKNSNHPILFVAGVDSDKDDFQELINQLEKEVHEIAKKSTIIFVAVRDVETWAEYLLKPESKRSELDKRSSKDQIYDDGKSNGQNAKKVINQLRDNNTFTANSLTHLATQSPSFAHFHQQIIAYLQNIS